MYNYLKKTVEEENAAKEKTEANSTNMYFQKDDVLELNESMIGCLHGDLDQAERTYNLN